MPVVLKLSGHHSHLEGIGPTLRIFYSIGENQKFAFLTGSHDDDAGLGTIH